jgi:Spy/CpxP family protein refolding chaperone
MDVRRIPLTARRLTLAVIVGAAVVGTVALAPSAQGQDPQGSQSGERMDPRQMIDQRMAIMTETLKLDSAQQTKIRSMLADETMAMEDLRKNGGGQRGGGEGGGGGGRRGGRGGGRRGGSDAPPDSARGGSGGGAPSPELRTIRERTNKQIEAVLNPQQLTTFRQLFEQGQQQRPAGDSASRRGRGSS